MLVSMDMMRGFMVLLSFADTTFALKFENKRVIDPTCATGMLLGNTCCKIECGSCGGSGCGDRPGGESNCCSSYIKDANKSCEDSVPPCMVNGNLFFSDTVLDLVFEKMHSDGYVKLRADDLQQADAAMDQFCNRMGCEDYWPKYSHYGADLSRKPVSRWFHTATPKEPKSILTPHNEHSYSGCLPSVIAFWGNTSDYEGGQTVLHENVESFDEDPVLATLRLPYTNVSGEKWTVDLRGTSGWNGRQYLQKPACDTLYHEEYQDYFLQTTASAGHQLQYPENITLKRTRHFPDILDDVTRHNIDRAYYEGVNELASHFIVLKQGDLLLIDNRRYSHSVLASDGLRQNYVGLLDDTDCTSFVISWHRDPTIVT